MENIDPLTDRVIGAAIEVHRLLGPGLLESVYQKALAIEFDHRGILHSPQHPTPVSYRGIFLGNDLLMDFLVEGVLVVELKAVERFEPVHQAQLLTYMKLGGYRTGLLINFNVRLLREGIKRMVL